MAAYKAFLTIMVAALVAAASNQLPGAHATDYVVGDDAGWTLNFNYTAWAEGKQFYVGDRLVFKYGQGAHNVYKVNGTDFQQCTVPPPSESLTTGNDVITLASPGRKWYICGVGKHCASGMKLVITVYEYSWSAPALPPTAAAAPTPAYGLASAMHAKKKPAANFWSNWKLKLSIQH